MRALAFVVVALAAVPASAAPIVSIEPALTTVSEGTTFTIDVTITDAADLIGYDFALSYDPLVLMANTITEGAFLSSGGSTNFIGGTIDNVLGTISLTGNSLSGPVPGVSGGGSLAIVSFTALAAGTTDVLLSDVLLSTILFNPDEPELSEIDFIEPGTANGSVEVTARVPEPAAVLLLGAGLAAGLRRRRVEEQRVQ